MNEDNIKDLLITNISLLTTKNTKLKQELVERFKRMKTFIPKKKSTKKTRKTVS